NALRGKFEKITEQDIDEYIHLKDMKAKYEKADEIFGKILNIFLLDLGLRMSAKQINDLKSAPPPKPFVHEEPPSLNANAEKPRESQPPPPKRKSRVNTRNAN